MKPLGERIMGKVRQDPNGCWTWIGANDGRDGYGRIVLAQKQYSAHRVSYEHFVGPIGEGLHIDHLCRNRACVNPKHLEPVTCGENIRRGNSGSSKRAVCQRGHDMAAYRMTRLNGTTFCGECERAGARRRYKQRTSK